ncbi:IS66 family transposase [Paraconexibacter antarcticus]|uniref:IS66 family transposase n=1 Tax=Paraconexibacter antarcticus TaxID=2949664 RepID=A0ABY5DKR3_9ACTN|nr:IS66 family transposase [Paraconexibacter antarcticus]UTI62318.1 IS66 family transposase [Paraconexibacter antarcticus]UTI65303.1 IS66 family transposase [Paraconexibacter antarcticus]
MERQDAEAIYEQGRDVVVAVLMRLDEQVQRLEKRVIQQDERIAVLERQLGRSSRNSSQPPSADPPRVPPRVKGPSGRAPGGQPGHEGKGRSLLEAAAVDEVVDYWPAGCGCGRLFAPGDLVAVGGPARHQVEELPVMAVTVTEHRCHHVICPGCGAQRRGELPAAVAASALGPRLQAAVVTLSVRNRISRRDVVELCEQLFNARVSVGTVDTILARVADALIVPCEDLLDRVRSASAVNMDETGWRLRGGQRAMWGAFTERHAILQITASRHDDHAKELLGGSRAIITSDRWWAYNHLPVRRRQICWSHLQRDFAFQAEGRGIEKQLGEAGLAVCADLFAAWAAFQQTGDRPELQRQIRLLQRRLKPVLREHGGKKVRYRQGRGFSRGLLNLWPALWTFARQPGVTPTNNHAERGLRGAVIYRKLSFGSQSENGEARIARLLSAHTTCRMQGRSLHEYLIQVLHANAHSEPVPLLA